MSKLTDQLEARLNAIDQRAELFDDDQFVDRVHALDVLQFQIMARIENAIEVNGRRENLTQLYQRAADLFDRLDEVNIELFWQLRSQLTETPESGHALPHLCDIYIGDESQAPPRVDQDERYLDVLVNGILGVEDDPEPTVTLQHEMIGYVPTPTHVIFALIEQLQLNSHDVVYDLGAGLGRIAMLVGLLSSARAVGVEIEPEYCDEARWRAEDLHLSRVSIINGDVREVDCADGTVFFMYTPFTGRLLQAVLDKLRDAAQARPIRVAAYGPCTPHFLQQDWLRPVFRQVFDNDELIVFASM